MITTTKEVTNSIVDAIYQHRMGDEIIDAFILPDAGSVNLKMWGCDVVIKIEVTKREGDE